MKSVDWHPTKTLLVSGVLNISFMKFLEIMKFNNVIHIPFPFDLHNTGGKDNLVKLWDAKTGRELCSL